MHRDTRYNRGDVARPSLILLRHPPASTEFIFLLQGCLASLFRGFFGQCPIAAPNSGAKGACIHGQRFSIGPGL